MGNPQLHEEMYRQAQKAKESASQALKPQTCHFLKE